MTLPTDRIKEIEAHVRDAYMGYYRHFHQNPEPSYQEERTAAFVADRLRELPLENIKTGVGGHGVTAVLKGAHPGPVVAIRADMDALNVAEDTGLPFASRVPGVMHACGHDAHTAMLLGVAHVLCEMRESLHGSVKFVFQPSEEMTPRGGSLGMIEDGALEDPHVDAILAMHVWPTFETGMIGTQDGIVSAASDHLTIHVTGKSAHASMPNDGIDAVVAGSAIVGALQPIVSRNVDPKKAAVITIGLFNGGSRYNVIPEAATLEGTVRTFDPAVTERMKPWIERAAVNTAAAYGAKATVDYESGYPSVRNDPKVAGLAREAVVEMFGESALLPVQDVPAIGEDFAFFAQRVPASFAWLGCRKRGVPAAEAPPLHNSKFVPDPDSLAVGVQYMAAAALKVGMELKA